MTGVGTGTAGTIDPAEVARFSALAAEWWRADGKFAPLHRLNPVRIAYIRDTVCRLSGRDPLAARPLTGLHVVDIGCGGGLLAEPMARLGANVVGIDASERNIGTAGIHAGDSGLDIDYRRTSAEELAATGARFDVVLAMEVIEHVADVSLFLASCATLLAPGGVLVLATLNRTPKAFALAIIGAEYVLRWLPRGTHAFRKFRKPSELMAVLRGCGLVTGGVAGVVYHPLSGQFSLAPHDLDVNYMLHALKPAE